MCACIFPACKILHVKIRLHWRRVFTKQGFYRSQYEKDSRVGFHNKSWTLVNTNSNVEMLRAKQIILIWVIISTTFQVILPVWYNYLKSILVGFVTAVTSFALIKLSSWLWLLPRQILKISCMLFLDVIFFFIFSSESPPLCSFPTSWAKANFSKCTYFSQRMMN